MGSGMLFGTVVVTVAWVFGFQPSLLASAGYFTVFHSLHLFFTLVVVPLPVAESTPETELAVLVLSVAPAAILLFTAVGTSLRTRLRQPVRSLLKLPPADHPSQQD